MECVLDTIRGDVLSVCGKMVILLSHESLANSSCKRISAESVCHNILSPWDMSQIRSKFGHLLLFTGVLFSFCHYIRK